MSIKIQTDLPSVVIGDLGITLVKGIPQWVTQDQYNRSAVLQNLERLGNVKCTNKPRSRVIHHATRAPIRTSKMSRPHKGGLHKPQETIQQAPQVNVEQVVEKAVAKATNDMLALMMGTLQDLLTSQNTQQSSEPINIESQIENAVTKALQNTSVVTSATPTTKNTSGIEIEEPMFIPSKIVEKENKVQVNTQQSSTDTTDDLQQALKALKQLRKNK